MNQPSSPGQVFVNIYGGLGNQLFQGALGYVVAAIGGTSLNFITDNFKDEELRTFQLAAFPRLRGRIVPPEDITGVPFIHENTFAGTPPQIAVLQLAELVRQGQSVMLSGLWQNDSYFTPWRDIVCQALRPARRNSLVPICQQLEQSQAIGVHQRRVGYGQMGLVKSSYYHDAIALIRQEKGDLPIYVFTDDPVYSKHLFGAMDNVHFPSTGNMDNPLDDFMMLSSCRHHVIANSTFSWWAAWLAETPEAIICAPQPWAAERLHKNPVPERWRRFADVTVLS